MARTLGVSKAGYYAWIGRPTSMRKVADAALLKRIRTVHLGSHETYARRASRPICGCKVSDTPANGSPG